VKRVVAKGYQGTVKKKDVLVYKKVLKTDSEMATDHMSVLWKTNAVAAGEGDDVEWKGG
jgi:hypothetical protein